MAENNIKFNAHSDLIPNYLCMKNILVHLHPDFAIEFTALIGLFNDAQSSVKFIGIRAPREHDVQLLTKGNITSKKTFAILSKMRDGAGFSPRDNIIGFTEKRLYEPRYYQLFVSGSQHDDKSPRITAISLDFARKTFSGNAKTKSMVYPILLSNIISVIAMTEGFETHEDTRGCPLDFCEEMMDVLEGINNGIQFCDSHIKAIRRKKKDYLFDLAEVVRKQLTHRHENTKLSRRIVSKEKARLNENASRFNYDIALSYSSKDRVMVDQVASNLKKKKIKVFYDRFEQEQLWGADLYTFLMDIYMRAKYSVMFISRNYAKSRWTTRELKAAQTAALKLNTKNILPVQIDNTVIKDIQPIGSIQWKDHGSNGITQLLIDKLKKAKNRLIFPEY